MCLYVATVCFVRCGCFTGFGVCAEPFVIACYRTALSVLIGAIPRSQVAETTVQMKPEPKNENTHIVKPDWFWYSIQNGFADENEYLYKDVSVHERRTHGRAQTPPKPHPMVPQYLESIADSMTPSADRRESLPISLSGHHHNNKRKRKLLSQKVHEITPGGGSGKRHSSVSEAGMLSASGSLLDYTASPSVLKFDGKKSLDASVSEPKKKSMRYNHFMDLFGTESNYVGILHTIVSVRVRICNYAPVVVCLTRFVSVDPFGV